MTETNVLDTRKTRAETWFQALRDTICDSFEQLEDGATGPFSPDAPREAGRFVRTQIGRAHV